MWGQVLQTHGVASGMLSCLEDLGLTVLSHVCLLYEASSSRKPPHIQECSLTSFLSFRSLEQHHSGPQEEFPEISRSKLVILLKSMSGIAMKYIHILIF